MTPPTTTPATGKGGRHAASHGYGLVLFASVVLFVTGCFNLVRGRGRAVRAVRLRQPREHHRRIGPSAG